MKIVYALVIIGALALFALLLWWARGQVGDAAAPHDSVGWYARHPDALVQQLHKQPFTGHNVGH